MSISARREMDVFHAALEIADWEERGKFLEQTCEGNDELRSSVEDLLAAQARAEQFFARGASSLHSFAGQLVEDYPPVEQGGHPLFEEKPGTILGRYKVVQKIGEGGCGMVYVAEQAQPVRRQVALKVIKLGMDTRSVMARFEAERQALAMMDHPNIARVFDAGATETGRPFFVMELVNGAKITEYCDQNQLGLNRRLELFVQVCQAIQHAHQKGIIHRDIKPSNILVTVHDGVAAVKVIDFGIAKATEERLTNETISTAYAQVIGTPAYMSPEQVDLNGTDLDTRSDIYSLGVLLYELLTGRTPFDSKELTGSGVDRMRRTLREQEPRAPSATLLGLECEELETVALQRKMAPSQVAAKVRGDLDWIAMKALEKDRARRYATASELAADVERYLKNEPVLARPPNRWYLLQKLIRRNRLVVVSGAAVVTALLIGAITSTWLLMKERDARRKVVAAQQEAKNRREAELLGRIAQAKLLLAANEYEKADKLFDGIVLEKSSVDAAAVLRRLGQWHALGNRWRQAAERFALLVRVDRLDSLDTVTIDYFELGPALIKSGDLNAYEGSRQEAIARYAGAENTYLDLILKFCLLLPANRQMMKDLVPQADFVEKAFPVADQHHSHDSGAEAWHAVALALFEYRRGDFAKAVTWCRRCLDYPQSVAPRSAAAEAILAMSYWQMNQHQEALSAMGRSRVMVAGDSNNMADSKAGSEQFWFDWEFARILFRECEERFLEADRSLSRTSGSTPNSEYAAMLRVLAEWHALRNEWREASDQFSTLIQINQSSDWEEATQDYLACGVAWAKLDDKEGYERFRTGAVARYKDTDNKTIAERVIKISLLRPADAKLLTALSPLEPVLVRPYNSTETDLKENIGYQSWSDVALGLLEYRRGNWKKAADWSRQSLASTDTVPMPASVGRVILAMSLNRLGQEEAARRELRQGREFIEFTGKYIDRSNWRDWLIGNILLGEANGLMPDADQATERKAR